MVGNDNAEKLVEIIILEVIPFQSLRFDVYTHAHNIVL